MRAGLFNEEIKLFKKVNKVSDFGSTKVEFEEWKKVRAKVEHKSETRIIESESGNRFVMKDRKIMANDGIVVVIANIDVVNNKLLGNPNITTRGFVQVNENQEMLRKLEEIAKHAINQKITKQINYTEIKNQIILELSAFISETTGRKPIILPVIMNIKKETK